MKPNRQPMFASLSVYNYRIFSIGSLISNVGSWMAIVAQDWLVLTVLTNHSGSALGLVSGLQFLPVALLSPAAGALIDRVSRRKLLLVTQSAAAVGTIVLLILVSADVVQLWHVYVLATVAGITMAYDNPARQAFISEMVPNELLPNAIGLNSASFNTARLLGPGLAGILIGGLGIPWALAINAVSYMAIIVALLTMHNAELSPAPRASGEGAIKAGLGYIWHRPHIMLVLFLVFMLGTFGMNFQLTNALMATTVFNEGAGAYGVLGSILAIGSLSAALLAARRTKPRLRVLFGSLAGFTVAMVLLGLAANYTMYAVMLVPVGLMALTMMTSANSMVQLAVEPEFRGRVMAIYMAIFMGGTPIGAPLIGWVGDAFGARWTLFIGAIATGIACISGSIYLIIHDRVRISFRPEWPPILIVEQNRH